MFGSFLPAMGLLTLALLWMTMLTACGSSGPTIHGPSVSVIDNEFSPQVLHINPGQRVTWVNNGRSSGVGALNSIASRGTPPAAILRVPQDYPTIQEAVNAAKPFDMILVFPGMYYESVTVKTPNLTIRGLDRNGVILDGYFTLDDGFEVMANNVVLENMTARHFQGNGFYWTGVVGFRGSYLTAYANGDYGIYAYGSNTGQFDHDLAAGQPDSGFYIGYCHPCHAIISHVISEDNALGYSGTNAGGDLTIEYSIWRDNMAGIAPNTLDSEPNPPESDTTIKYNLVENNNNYNAPAKVLEYPSIGNGIVIGGGNNNHISNNIVKGHTYYGILIVPNIDQNFWEPSGNVVENNTISDSGVADIGFSALSAGGNCFSNNTVARTSPPFLQFTHDCGSLFANAGAGDPSVAEVLIDHFVQANLGRFTPHDWRKGSAPEKQAGMPDTSIDPQGIFTNLEGITSDVMVPAATSISPSITLGGLGLANPFFEVLLGFYLYYLPIALYSAWLSVATWDIVRREMGNGARIGWLAIVFLIPVLGPIAYYLFGRSQISRITRVALVIGAPAVYLILSILLLLLIS